MAQSLAIVGGSGFLTERLAADLATGPEPYRCRVLRGSRAAPGEGIEEGEVVLYVAAERPGARHGPDPADAGEVFARCAERAVPALVVVASAAIYEPNSHQPGLASEEQLRPGREGNPIPERWRALEKRAAACGAAGGPVVTMLRAPVVAGDPAGAPLGPLLPGRWMAVLPGRDPAIQLLALDDLSRAVRAALRAALGGGRGGTFNLAPAGALPLRAALRLAGVRRGPVPHWLMRLARRVLAPAGLAPPAAAVEYRRYPWTVSAERAHRSLGFTPRHDTAEALLRLLPGEKRAAAARKVNRDGDDFGLDRAHIDRLSRTVWAFLHDRYWRVELAGLEHVPRQGRAVLVGLHRGFFPFDGIMIVHALWRALRRVPRFLIHPGLVRMAFFAPFFTRIGGVPACAENADRILSDDGLLAVFPEGVDGAFRLYRDAYRIGSFGRDRFVAMAIRNRAPIVPFVTVGSAEALPAFGRIRWRWWRRRYEWPFVPLTPSIPLVPLPLPSKWHTRFLPPLHVERLYGPEAASDPAVRARVSEQVRDLLGGEMDRIRRRRRSIFYGNVFDRS